MKLTLTHKNVKAAVSHDSLRPAMQGALYRPEEKELVATNGHILVRWPVEPSEGDTPGVVPLDAFHTTGIHKNKRNEDPELRTNGKIETVGNVATKVTEFVDEEYPQFERVWTENEDPTFEIGFSLDTLQQLIDSFPASANNRSVRFRFSSKNRAAYVESLERVNYNWRNDQDDDRPVFRAIVMPCMLNEYA